VDTVDKCFDGSFNNDQDVRSFFAGVERLAAPSNANVLLVHHTGSDTSRGPMGSEVFRMDSDSVFEVKRLAKTNPSLVRISPNKDARDGGGLPMLTFAPHIVTLPDHYLSEADLAMKQEVDGDGQPTSSLVFTLSDADSPQVAAAKSGAAADNELTILNYCRASNVSTGLRRDEIGAATGISGGSLNRAISALQKRGQIVSPRRGRFKAAA
jgi:hypothetical protein